MQMNKLLLAMAVLGSMAFGSATAQAQDLDMTVQVVGAAWIDDAMLHELIADGAQELLGYEAIVRTQVTRSYRLTTVTVHVESPTLGTDNIYRLRQLVERTAHRGDITVPTVDGRPWRRGDPIVASR